MEMIALLTAEKVIIDHGDFRSLTSKREQGTSERCRA